MENISKPVVGAIVKPKKDGSIIEARIVRVVGSKPFEDVGWLMHVEPTVVSGLVEPTQLPGEPAATLHSFETFSSEWNF
jgi:hypothetical protein